MLFLTIYFLPLEKLLETSTGGDRWPKKVYFWLFVWDNFSRFSKNSFGVILSNQYRKKRLKKEDFLKLGKLLVNGKECSSVFCKGVLPETHLNDRFLMVLLRARAARLLLAICSPASPFDWACGCNRCVCDVTPSWDASTLTDPVREPPLFSKAAMSRRQLKNDCFCTHAPTCIIFRFFVCEEAL